MRDVFEAEAKAREKAMASAASAASALHHDEEVLRTAQPAQVEEIPNKNHHIREEDHKQNSPSHRGDPAPEV